MQYNALQTIQAFEAGQGQRKERERERTMQGVGNALAGGNYAGGAGLMFNMGDIQGGMQLQQYGKSLEDAEAEKKRVASIRYGMQLLNEKPEARELKRSQIVNDMRTLGYDIDDNYAAQMDLSDKGIQDTLALLQDTDSLMAQYQSMMAPTEYGLDLVPVQGPDGKIQYVQASKSGGVRPVEGFTPVPEAADPFTLGPGQVRYNPDGTVAARGPERTQSAGIRIGPDGTVQIGGPVDGLGYGSGSKGQEAAIVQGRDGQPLVSPGPQQEAYSKAMRGLGEFQAQNAIVLEDIDRALQNVNSGFSTGAWAATKDLPIFGGVTPAGELESLLETIQANVGFDKLQAMREASPTGGALGSVTERELAFLQAVFGSLRQDTSPENVRYNLQRLKEHMQGREARLQAAIAADFPTLQQTAQFRAQTNQQVQALSADEAAELQALKAELGIE